MFICIFYNDICVTYLTEKVAILFFLFFSEEDQKTHSTIHIGIICISGKVVEG